MKRPIRPDELKLWGLVASTVHPFPGRALPKAAEEMPASTIDPQAPPARIPPPPRAAPAAPRNAAEAIEPRRHRRIARERDPIGSHIDLHGLGQDQARVALERFVLECWNAGDRAVLVITGKGLRGDGVLRRLTPEWLAAPHLREIVAGVAESHRRHGGEGALYVALKRKRRT